MPRRSPFCSRTCKRSISESRASPPIWSHYRRPSRPPCWRSGKTMDSTLKGSTLLPLKSTTAILTDRRILEAIGRQSAQVIAGYSWQQAKAFEVAENAVDAAGKGGMLGALMMTSMMGTGQWRNGRDAATIAGRRSSRGSLWSGRVWRCAALRAKSFAQTARRNTPAVRNSVLTAATRMFRAPGAVLITTKLPAAA